MAIFDHAQPKIIESTLCSPGFVPASKNQLFHLLILEIQSVLEPSVFTGTKLDIPIFYYAQPQNFQSHSNLHELVQAYKKSVNSICSFLR